MLNIIERIMKSRAGSSEIAGKKCARAFLSEDLHPLRPDIAHPQDGPKILNSAGERK